MLSRVDCMKETFLNPTFLNVLLVCLSVCLSVRLYLINIKIWRNQEENSWNCPFWKCANSNQNIRRSLKTIQNFQSKIIYRKRGGSLKAFFFNFQVFVVLSISNLWDIFVFLKSMDTCIFKSLRKNDDHCA